MSIERVGGIQGEFTQNSRGIQAEFKENSGRIPVDGSEMVRRWLEDGSKMVRRSTLHTRYIHGGNTSVPRWDQNSPTLGTKQSHTGTKTMKGSAFQYDGFVLRSFRYAACLILMMIVGIGEMWGQPFTLTTASDITNGTQKYYLIQSIDRPSFYAIPHSNADGAKVSTTSIPNANMRWCFVDAGSDSDHQYYYIVNSTGRCLYRNNANNDGILIKKTYADLSSLSDDELNKYKFYLTQTGSDYFIQPKGHSNEYLNKRGGNIQYTGNYYIKASTYNDEPSFWNFVAVGSVTWSQPFTVSTNSEKHYYKFKNVTNTSFFLSNSGEWATVSNASFDEDIWYFLEAGVDATYSNFHYYYIVNAVTGKYLYHTGGTGNDVAKVLDYNSAEADKFRFLIVDAAYKPTNEYYATGYTIVPKLRQANFSDKDSYAPMAMSDGSHLLLKSDRGSGNYDSHWDIVATDYVENVEAPTITNNFDGTISLSTTTDGATIYYTTNGDTPDNTSTPYSSPFSLGNATVIKAITYLGEESSDVTIYNVPQYDAPTISFNNANSQVTINPGSGGTAYYNTGDGSQADPTTSSTAYSAPFTVSSATTVKAIATHAGYLPSSVAELPIAQVATPIIQNNGNDAFSITCATDGASIYYATSTDDGSTYGDYTEYNDTPLTGLASGTYIKAYASKTGLINSAESEPYIVRQACATPTISITYNNDGTATVSMTTDTNGATIHYTTDGTNPDENSTSYPGIFADPVTTGMTIRAIAVKDNYNNSGIAEETVVQVATPDISIVNNTITITCGTDGATIYYKVDDGDFTEYTAALGLSDNVSGHAITAYATKSSMVKSANAVATASETMLTLPTPTIQVLASPNGENKNVIFSISPTITGVTFKYTLDGTDPSESNGTEAGSILLGSPAIIKVIAIHPNYVASDVASSTSYVIPTNMPLLIQSQANAWNSTDFHFYMIPGDEANSIIKVNTTSLFRPTMEWHFENAGDGYYYIVNNYAKDNSNNPYYLCYDGTNVQMLAYDSSDANKFKFKIVASSDAGSFNIVPYAQRNATGNTARYINKAKGNGYNDAINLDKGDQANSRWRFILPSALDMTAPFTVSIPASDSYSYYKIASVGSSGHYIVPGATNATTSNSSDADVMKSGVWYFEQAQAANASDWCTYYYIRNAETREFLYFTKDANNKGACLEMRNTIEVGNEDRYMFTWAKTADANVDYYIIPKLLKDVSQNQFSSLRKHDSNTSILTNVTRGAGNFAWTFETALFCEAPAFKEKEIGGVNKIEISCITAGAEIYYTTDGSEPTSSSTHYSGEITSPSGSDQMIIRAIAVVSDANLTPSSATSKISTLLYNPDITLDPTYDYGYDGTAKEPTATVSLGEFTAPTTAYTINYSGDNINVGTNTATATIVDATGDNWYILGSNLSVTFSITQPTIDIIVTIADWTYGTTASTPSVSGNPEGTDNTITYEYKVKDAGNNTYTSTVPTNAGDYTIKATLPDDPLGNYGQSVATTDFTINKATLTVTGNDSKNYGEDDPTTIAYDVEGLASWDDVNDVLTGSLTRAAGENTGSYTINQGTLALNSAYENSVNYTLEFAGGTFRIIGTDITVTLSMNGWTYGDDVNEPSFEVTSPTDYPTNTATVTYYYKKKGQGDDKYTEEAPINAGTYIVKLVIAPNVSYEGAEEVKEFTISKATLTVTADNKTKGYGDPDPELTYTVSGLKYTDVEQMVLSACELQREAGEDLGNYAITKTSHTISSNYSLSFVNGTFTITNKLLGDAETHAPTAGISIYAKKDGDSWTVKVYHGGNELVAGTDYTFNSNNDVEVVDAVNGIYSLKINSTGNNYGGYALTTYQDCGSDFKPISEGGESKKIMPFHTTEEDLSTSNDLVPCIVGQVNPSIGTISIVPISYIPKDVPVLLLAPSDVTGITTSPKNPAIPDISESLINSNKLMIAPDEPSDPNDPESVHGVHVENTEAYMYYKGEFVLTTEGTIKPGNFFIYNPNYKEQGSSGGGSGAPKRYLQILVGETTGILQLTNDEKTGNDSWYTIDGRKLNGKPQERGLYINGGKKVMVK